MNTDNIHWYGHDSFRIEDGSRQIYIDPWKMPNGLPRADLILVTHDHYDHFSAEDIEALRRDDTPVVCPGDSAAKLGDEAIAVKPGDEIEVSQWKIAAVPAYNIGKEFHPKQNAWVGYIVTLSDGTRVYHAGDTDRIPEMDDIDADIALLPVSGTYVMTAEEAVAAANAIRPQVAIPMHYGEIVGEASDAETLKKGFSGETAILKDEG